MLESPKRRDPIPCPICGADIDPQLLENEHILFGTEVQKILEAIPEWGCFAVPGFTHSPWEWPEGAKAAQTLYSHFTAPTGAVLTLEGIQHAWSILRPSIQPFYQPYVWVPERLREVALRSV
jgi:hypothetical protein